MSSNRDDSASSFADAWDGYVDQARSAGQDWPGDDWGDAAMWDQWFVRLFGRFDAGAWCRAVEVGQGTGKYTARVLKAGEAEVLACDVSGRFLELCRERLADYVALGRLHTAQIGERDPDVFVEAVAGLGWTGTVDAVFSIDTLVHLSFTQVVAVMLAATEVLRPRGLLTFSYACATSDAGRKKLVSDLDRVIRAGSGPATGCFHWLSPDLVRATAEAMGFEVEICDVDPYHHRDGHFVGRLHDPDRAAAARAMRQR